MKLIGREKEIKTLQEAYSSRNSVFLALYGRRRVGKTFLVRNVLSDHFSFSYSGKANISKLSQLKSFRLSLLEQGMEACPVLSDWFTAFHCLKEFVSASCEKKKVIFLDEVAWMDNQKSDFVSALEGFWNEWASNRDDIFLIICASATSWIIDNVFHNRGGLHNRVTTRIKLSPFTLSECEDYSDANNLNYSRKEILSLYMAIGGVAWYWALLRKGYSVKQNLAYLFLEENSPLRGEFCELYQSLFKKPDKYIEIIRHLGKKGEGMNRQEISRECKVSNNVKLGTMLEELEECGFIRSNLSFGKQTNGKIYQLTDSFSLFFLKFLSQQKGDINPDLILSSQSYSIVCDLAFEKVVFNHMREVKKALGISGINTNVYSWKSDKAKLSEGEKGAQIDMIIDRSDNVINIVEAKWSSDGVPFLITKKTEEDLIGKKHVFVDQTKTKKSVFLTMVTLSGIVNNQHSDIIQSSLVLDDLFL